MKYLPQYKFLEGEFTDVFTISALTRKHIGPLLTSIFSKLPDAPTQDVKKSPVVPLLNMTSKLFVAELIREKVFLKTGDEVPYTATAVVDAIEERENKLTYIKARILTTSNRYKKMLIGKEGRKIKEMGSMARRELELALNKKVYLDLTVETDPHWQEVFYS